MTGKARIGFVLGLLLISGSAPATAEEVAGGALRVPRDLVLQCESKLANSATSADELAACKALMKLAMRTPSVVVPKQASGRVVAAPDGTATPAVKPPANVEPARLYVRADRIDNLFYGVVGDYSSGQAKGASVSYTDNRLTQSQNVTISGTVSYVLSPTPIWLDPDHYSNFAVAAWLSGNGTWEHPLKAATDTSALKTGLDFQYMHFFPEGALEKILVDVAPYAQTDFDGRGRGGGTSFTLEPVIPAIYLGQSSGGNRFFNGFWIFRPEYDVFNVTNPGLTKLTTGTYEWLGETTRAYLFLFPSYNYKWPTWLADKFAVFATAQYYWDAHSKVDVRYYSAELQYNLSGCTAAQTSRSDCPQGTAALSFEYDWGTDRDTLVQTQKYLMKLSYKN